MKPHNPRGNSEQPATPLRRTQVYGARWEPPKEACGGAHQATFNHLSAVLANQGGPSGLRVSKCDVHLQEKPEGPRELQACQSDLDSREGYGTDHLECHHMAHTGQSGYQAQSARV